MFAECYASQGRDLSDSGVNKTLGRISQAPKFWQDLKYFCLQNHRHKFTRYANQHFKKVRRDKAIRDDSVP